MDVKQAFEFIDSFGKSGRPVSDLSRIKSLLNELSNPQRSLKFIHVAGTNGKGSVCEMLTEAICHEGLRVGTFTSPYILEYCDRIRINKQNIPTHYLVKYAEIVSEAVSRTGYGKDFSQFEITMCIALLYFRERACDVVVWETGIGGKNDCTNVIENPLVSIICSVSFDHTAMLGNTIEEIATQKCGIIKEGCPCVMSFGNDAKAQDIFIRTAICRYSPAYIPNCTLLEIVSDTLDGCGFVYKGKAYRTAMCGIHQAANASTVIEAFHAMRNSLPISQTSIEYGISHAKIHARAEVINKEPLIILDGGHNPNGFSALSHLIRSKTSGKRTVLIGMLKDKEAISAVSHIASVCDTFITVDGFHPNAIDSNELAEEIGRFGVTSYAAGSVSQGFSDLIRLSEGGVGIICGSLYLASQILTEQLPKL